MKKSAYFVGHSHIDAVWLWDREETKEVLIHTFNRVLDLMDKNEDFYFIQSSAQFYKWMEEMAPQIFERISRHIKEGRWEVTGGMWVEPDTNAISGESYARQIYYGKKYFRDKFGIDVKLAWLPDSFGFPNTLPMILKEGGLSYFYTAKLNFEHPLHFPYYIFNWQAPDGSSVLAVHTFRYEGDPTEKSVKSALGLASIMHPNYDRFMIVYGEGDHGGGISQEMVDHIRELKEKKTLNVEMGRAVDYYDAIDSNLFPVWNDELYLKTHHGTYTTQGNFRRKNRQLEGLLYKAEVYSTLASSYGYPYPYERIDYLWELLLFNQFHDALAGSSIPKVYEDAWKDLSYIESEAIKIKDEALEYIVNFLSCESSSDSLVVFNPFNFSVSKRIVYKGKDIYVKDIPPFGYKKISYKDREEIPMLSMKAGDGEIHMENEFISLTISEETGLFTSIFNKGIKKEFLSGPGNLIQVYEDDDLVESAWNIHLGREELLTEPDTIRIVKDTPMVKEVEITYIYKQDGRPDSTIEVFVSLDAYSPYINVKMKMDLHSHNRTYKIAFPVDIDTQYTTYETPYGYIDRIDPIAPDANSFERYKREVPGGKWVDRSGFTLINDGRFGFDVSDGETLRMSFARTVKYPKPVIMALDGPLEDEYTDQGRMEISYLVYPHGKDWKKERIPYLAHLFNIDLDIVTADVKDPTRSLFSFSQDVIVTAFKKSKDGDGNVIRFYEPLGKSAVIKGEFIKSNILEDEIERIENYKVASLSLSTLIKKGPN